MNGGADLGGMMGFGPVVEEKNEPHFHAEWEARVLGMVIALAACGQWNLDKMRYARESLQPADYMQFSYYHIWLEAALNSMRAAGMVTEEEVAAGAMLTTPIAVKGKLEPANVPEVLNRGGPVDRPEQGAPGFAIGQQVKTINNHPMTHTRMARYARDKVGVVTKVHGFHVFPDSNALGQGENPEWLYQVTFSARALWGDQGAEGDTVSLDLWAPYLSAVS